MIVHHSRWRTLELRWLHSTRDMSDDGFKESLQLLATEGERLSPAYMFIDAIQLFHELG